MPRPRVDYIVLNSYDSSGGVAPSRSWAIQPHMYRQWQPRDEIVMSLIACTFDGTANTTVPRGLAIMADIPCSNQYRGSDGNVHIGTCSTKYTSPGTKLTADELQRPLMELHTDRLNTITISVMDTATTFIPMQATDCRFIFEVRYYQPEM